MINKPSLMLNWFSKTKTKVAHRIYLLLQILMSVVITAMAPRIKKKRSCGMLLNSNMQRNVSYFAKYGATLHHPQHVEVFLTELRFMQINLIILCKTKYDAPPTLVLTIHCVCVTGASI